MVLAARGVRLSLGGSINHHADPRGQDALQHLATFAEFEVDLLRLRTREGMAIAQGRLKERQPKLSTKQQAELLLMHASGEYTVSDIAELFSVSRPMVYRTLKRRPGWPAGSPDRLSRTLPAPN